MNPIVMIRIFYKNNKGNLIAIQRKNKLAKWYRYSFNRSAVLSAFCMNSPMTHTDISDTQYVITFRAE